MLLSGISVVAIIVRYSYDIRRPCGRDVDVFSPSRKAPQAEEEGLGRASSGFVGLDNQGATCYLNALLQVCYHKWVRDIVGRGT